MDYQKDRLYEIVDQLARENKLRLIPTKKYLYTDNSLDSTRLPIPYYRNTLVGNMLYLIKGTQVLLLPKIKEDKKGYYDLTVSITLGRMLEEQPISLDCLSKSQIEDCIKELEQLSQS